MNDTSNRQPPARRGIRRWFKSTSNRTFIVYPLVIILFELLIHGGRLNVLHGDVAGRLVVSARDADAAGAWALCLVDPSAAHVERRAYRVAEDDLECFIGLDLAVVRRQAPNDSPVSRRNSRSKLRALPRTRSDVPPRAKPPCSKRWNSPRPAGCPRGPAAA